MSARRVRSKITPHRSVRRAQTSKSSLQLPVGSHFGLESHVYDMAASFELAVLDKLDGNITSAALRIRPDSQFIRGEPSH
ncbi:hypothetical protein BH20ACI2_BH20ACI2_04380 [soil metagenome]